MQMLWTLYKPKYTDYLTYLCSHDNQNPLTENARRDEVAVSNFTHRTMPASNLDIKHKMYVAVSKKGAIVSDKSCNGVVTSH